MELTITTGWTLAAYVVRTAVIMSALLYLLLLSILVLPDRNKLPAFAKMSISATFILAIGVIIVNTFLFTNQTPITLTTLLQPFLALFFVLQVIAVIFYESGDTGYKKKGDHDDTNSLPV